MNDIIKNIEAAQLRENVPEFKVGDTVKVKLALASKISRRIDFSLNLLNK